MKSNTTFNIEEINGVKYEVFSNYIGEISLLDLIKKLIKRDIENSESKMEQKKLTYSN